MSVQRYKHQPDEEHVLGLPSDVEVTKFSLNRD